MMFRDRTALFLHILCNIGKCIFLHNNTIVNLDSKYCNKLQLCLFLAWNVIVRYKVNRVLKGNDSRHDLEITSIRPTTRIQRLDMYQ